MKAQILQIWAMLKSRRCIWMPALAFLITRLGIAGVAYFSTPILVDSAVPPYHIRPDHILIDAFGSRWDTGFYLSIAEEGYQITGEPFPSVPFFPLLPLLIRLVRPLTGDSLSAGLLIVNLALVVAVMLLHRLAASEFSEAVADRAVWYLLIFPVSFFGSAIYTEALFLLVSIAAYLLARQGRWGWAGMVGFLAGLTRFTGLSVSVLLAGEWLRQRSRDHVEEGQERPIQHRLGWLAAGLPPLGVLAYMAYLHLQFGDALAFLHASSAWARVPRSPLAVISELLVRPVQGWGAAIATGALPLDNWLDLGFVVSFLVMGIVLCVQRRWSEGLFVLLGAALPFSSGLLMSQRRYMWVLFPVFLLLARWGENPWVDRLVFVFSLLGLGLFTALFANWYWVG